MLFSKVSELFRIREHFIFKFYFMKFRIYFLKFNHETIEFFLLQQTKWPRRGSAHRSRACRHVLGPAHIARRARWFPLLAHKAPGVPIRRVTPSLAAVNMGQPISGFHAQLVLENLPWNGFFVFFLFVFLFSFLFSLLRASPTAALNKPCRKFGYFSARATWRVTPADAQ